MDSGLIISFLTLSLLEIVLGVDNLIFIALITEKLPKELQARARIFGFLLALIIRIVMLAGLSFIMQLTEPLFSVFENHFSWRDLLMIGGGVFLIGKSTLEMHHDINHLEKKENHSAPAKISFKSAIIQIVIVDFVFSFDSVIAAAGLVSNLYVMVAAVLVSMVVMLAASKHISLFLVKFPTFKMLALSFILMIGTMLVAEGMGIHVPKAYVYFAFSFSMLVEFLNILARRKMGQ